MESTTAVLTEISRWSIEAKDEDTERYFYYFDDIKALEEGYKNYVIGRKGTGKTAIAEYLHQKDDYNRFSSLLSFKNFPFNFLYEYKDHDYNRPNQYITIWTYVIYHHVCSLMARNEMVTSRCSREFKSHFQDDIHGALSRSLKRITNSSYNLSFLGTGGGYETGSETEQFDLVRGTDVLRDFVLENIDESEYYIIFDELDEDYRDILNPDRKDGYFELLISLFKACQIVRSDFSKHHAKVRPVVFLRNDIFDLCRDVDKNKWLDRSVRLDWDVARLRNLVNFRLSRAIDPSAEVAQKDVWSQVFSVTTTRHGHLDKNRAETFNYLTSRTFLRPRDLISFIRECARIADSQEKDRIGNDEIKEAAKAHSAYLRREVIDEVFPVLDDIAEVLGVLSKIRKQIFTRKEFNDRYREYVNQNRSHRPILSESRILQLLYHFNVIGNITRGNHRVFAYDSDAKVLNMDEHFCVHNGLIHSLDIM